MTFFQTRSAALAIAMLGLAAPAFAQDNLCGGAGAGGQWIGGDEATSDITSVDAFREQMALVLNGNQYISLFLLSEATDVRLEASPRGTGDPVLDLFDSEGQIVLTADDEGGERAARAESQLAAGTYCMAVRNYASGPMTAFVRVGRDEHEALTTGVDALIADAASAGSCSEKTPFGPLGTSVTASVDQTSHWGFTLDAPTEVRIYADNVDADPTLKLYDSAGDQLGENDDTVGLNPRLDLTPALPAGEYCVEVDALNDTSLPIELTISEYDAETALRELYASGEVSPPLDGSHPVTGLGDVKVRLQQDVQASVETSWYSVDVEEYGVLIIETVASDNNNDPWLVVYDDLGRQVAQNDDYDGLSSLVVADVEHGTYTIGVKLINDNGQGLVRISIDRYVRAQ